MPIRSLLAMIVLSSVTSVSLAAEPLADGTQVELAGQTWTAEIAGPAGQIAPSEKSADQIVLSATGGTDMWGSRAGAPILMTDAPEGNFAIEVAVEYPDAATNAVAGVCVYSGGKNATPNFTFGLDHWGGSQKVKLQGLPPFANNPGLESHLPACRKVYLKLECCRKTKTGWQTDSYRGYYKLKADDEKWILSNALDRDVPSDKIGLFLKTDAPQSVTFSQAKITSLPDKLDRVGPVSPPPRVVSQPRPNLKPVPVPPDTTPDPNATKHPLVTKQPILFVARLQYRGDHHNTATMFQTGEINTGSFTGGSALRAIDFADGGKVTTLLECPEGVIRDPDVSFDGTKVLFSMRNNIQDDYHIYEIGADGTGLRQITFGSGISDIDPIYLPDGRLLFSSSREPKFCMCNRHIMCNLFTMEADGANIQQIGHSTLFEGHPCLLPDGRVLYDRWEYVDRNFGDAQGIWVTNPDGTQHAIYYGNNTNSPGAVLDTRPIPGTNLVICTFSSCHDRPWGAIAIVDRTKGIDMKEPVVRTWPGSAINLVGHGNYDTYRQLNPKYEDPYALSDSVFLCSRQVAGEKTGIVLLDMDNHETVLYQEPAESRWGCFDPMPLAPREKPRTILPRTDLAQTTGVFYVSNVYDGTGMDQIEPGTVKWLRVVESPEKRFWTGSNWNTGTGTQAPGMAWDDFNNKRILGTVPVEEDGSAHFEVPADVFLYFQLLDEEGRMVQSMRSGTIVRPGEQQGCIGCHEDRLNAVAPRRTVKALLRGPDKLEPWYGEPRLFNYVTEVQPVFDKHCMKCHDYDGPGAKRVCLAGDLNLIFNCSYFELRKNRELVKVPGAGPHQTLHPRSWGSYVSPLARVVLEGHGDPERDKHLNLSQEDKDRVVTWIDINAPYYPDYASAYRKNRYGRSPIDDGALNRLSQLVNVNLGQSGNANQVVFTRPEKSPCLKNVDPNSDAYQEALAILAQGKANLAATPRADMAAFKLVDPTEIAAEEKYQALLKLERERLRAIAEGQKVYDPRPQQE